jgi:hypothetical protein
MHLLRAVAGEDMTDQTRDEDIGSGAAGVSTVIQRTFLEQLQRKPNTGSESCFIDKDQTAKNCRTIRKEMEQSFHPNRQESQPVLNLKPNQKEMSRVCS